LPTNAAWLGQVPKGKRLVMKVIIPLLPTITFFVQHTDGWTIASTYDTETKAGND